jgi:D-alanyl-D-alanine carboxypeptidase
MRCSRYLQAASVVGLLMALPACENNDNYVKVESIKYEIPQNSLDPRITRRIDKVVETYARKGLPGIAVMVDGGQDGFYSVANGYACLEDMTPMTVYQVQHTGSHPKLHTAAATLLLAEQGKIVLDRPIADYLAPKIRKCVANASRITVRQLLNHTSGLAEFDDSPTLYFKRTNAPFEMLTKEDILDIICDLEPDSEPGEAHAYRNTNYYLMTLIIDQVTGRDHGWFFKEEMYDPLNMTHSYYRVQDHYYYPDLPPSLVNMYEDRYGTGEVVNMTISYHLWLTALPGCDGLVSAPIDLVTFLGALFRGQLLDNPDSLDQMLEGVYDPEDDSYYGLGVYMSTNNTDAPNRFIGHSGSTQGSGMLGYYFPNRDYVVVAMTNHGANNERDGELWWKGFWPDLQEALFAD